MACFLSNISAKYYENPTMLSRATAKNVGDVFLRHSVECRQCMHQSRNDTLNVVKLLFTRKFIPEMT